MKTNLLYLIDTRTRFCEVGAWAVSQTATGDLVLRRVLSLGSLWDLREKGNIKFNGFIHFFHIYTLLIFFWSFTLLPMPNLGHRQRGKARCSRKRDLFAFSPHLEEL